MRPYVVAGGGAIEVELATKLRDFAETVPGKEQLAVKKFAEALEIIPSSLAENAGLDTIDIMAELRRVHEAGQKWAGVDVYNRKVSNMWDRDVLEPLSVKEQVIKSAAEAASMIIRIDDVIAAGKIKEKEKPGEKEKLGETGGEFD
jgi:chaperonin GroEL (HSP60 family)